MKALSVLAAATMLLAACGGTRAPVKVDDRILSEMDRAAQRAPAATPEAVSQSLLPPLKADLPRATAQPIETRFDLVVNNASAREVFNSIVSGTRYSMLIHPDVAGAVSVNLKDVTVREALESIREVYGYEYKVDGTRIYIQPAGLQTRVFHVNYLIGLRAGRSDVRVGSGAITGNFQGSGQGAAGVGTTGLPMGIPGITAGVAGAPGAPGQQQQQTITAVGAAALSGLPSDASRVSTLSQSDLWNELTNALRTLIGSGEGRNVVVSPQSGVIVVRAMPQELRSVETYLKAMRISVERQVMIEAKIINVVLSEAFQSGVNWAAFPTSGITAGVIGQNTSNSSTGSAAPLTTLGTTGGISATAPLNLAASPGQRAVSAGALAATSTTVAAAAGAAGAGVFGLALQAQNFAALLQFLEAQGAVQVLSSPRVATMNNQKAVLKVGTDQFYVTNITGTPITGTTAVGGTTTGVQLTPTFNSFFSGVSLDITPQIDEEGNILLHIHPLVSNVSDGTKKFNFGSGIGIVDVPLARSEINETDTIVRVQDGNIVALGGLMKLELDINRAGLPGAQDASLLGALFGNRSRTTVKTELVILLKPTVIKGDKDWEQDIEQTRDRLKALEASPPPAPAAGAR